jgi:prepilin-type N-terminal cleavage/methylation domain-containing protein
MTSPRLNSMPRAAQGFTLLELLAVIAIVGVLAGILIPTTTAARASAHRARTRVQFSQWAAALEAFRQEYGSYPDFATGGAALINAAATTETADAHCFHDVLAGRRRNGSALQGSALAQNSRRVRFVTFAESDFVRPSDVAARRNSASELNLVRDAFHNTSIAIVVDANLDGLINALDAPNGFPTVVAPESKVELRPAVILSDAPDGVHAGVIFYCAPPGATSATDLIVSWR